MGLVSSAHMRLLPSISWVLVLWAVGCGDSGGGNDTGTGSTTTDASGSTFVSPSTSDTTSAVVDTTTGPPPGPGGDCILEDNDCTEPTQKCMPWSEQPDRIPDRARCCPLQDTPDLVGEPCTAEEYDGSCIDSCEAGSMCLIDNPDSLQGLCRGFCDPDMPTCDGGEGTCKSFFELLPGSFTVPLCMDQCDPLTQDCSPPSWHCIPDSPSLSGQSGFICVPPPPQEPVAPLEACGLANDCAKGLVCVLASRVPDGCGASPQCCTAYCSLSDGDGPCQDIDPALTCVDWMAPDPAWQDVGVCALPS
jgi:hypothetical protein